MATASNSKAPRTFRKRPSMPAEPSPSSAIGPIAEHEIDALAALMRDTIQPLAYYNERARRAELAKYTTDELRSLVAEDPQAVLVARDSSGLLGFCVSRFDDGTLWL